MRFAEQRRHLTVLEGPEQHVNITLNVKGCVECVVISLPAPEIAVPSPTEDKAPSECRNGSLNTRCLGHPLFSTEERGVRYGLSLPQNHVVSPASVPLYVWVDSTSRQEIYTLDPGVFSVRTRKGEDPLLFQYQGLVPLR